MIKLFMIVMGITAIILTFASVMGICAILLAIKSRGEEDGISEN